MIYTTPKELYANLFLCLLLVVFLFIPIAGCSQHIRYYFYDGSPRSSTDVATVALRHHLRLIYFDNIPLLKFPKTFDISPGEHALDILYSKTTEVYSKTKITTGSATLKLNAKSGHVYYIYPTFLTEGRWQLTVADFARPDDFSMFQPGFWSSLNDGHDIENKVGRHFRAKQTHNLQVSERNHWE